MRVKLNTDKTFPVVLEKKLSKNPYGRGNPFWGRCFHDTGVTVIDPRLKPLDFLDTMIHELLHREFAFMREETVTDVATVIAKELWEKGFRRCYP